jgi:chromate transport protein ChrA
LSLTARRLWKLYRRCSAADPRVRWVAIGAGAVVAVCVVFVPMLVVLLAVAVGGTYAVLRSPLCDGLWVGDDVDDWA